MFYIKDKDNKYVISKNAIAELPKRDEVTEMLKLEESQRYLREVIHDARDKMEENTLRYRADVANLFVPIISVTTLMIATDFAIGFKLATGSELTFPVAGVLVITNLVCAPLLCILGKEKVNFDKKHKATKVQFNTIQTNIEKEIQRQSDEERNIPGNDLELKTAYIKIRTL